MAVNNINITYQNPKYTLPASISLATIESALASLRCGNFDAAYQLFLRMQGDSRLAAVIQTRVSAMFKDKLQIVNQNNKKDTKLILDGISDADLKKIYTDVLFFGIGLGQVYWTLDGDRYRPKIKHYLLLGLRYDQSTDKYFILTIPKSDKEIQKRVTEIQKTNGYLPISDLMAINAEIIVLDESDPKWFIIQNGTRGHLTSLINSVSVDWLNKQLAQADLNNFNYNQNGRLFKLYAPAQTDEQGNVEFCDSLNKLMKNSTISLPQGTNEYDSYDVEIVDPTSSSVYQTYENQIKESQTNYAVAILSNNLTTEVNGGSYAAAETHKDIQDNLTNSDKEILFKHLNNQYIEKYKAINNPSYSGEFLFQIDKTDMILKQIDVLNQFISVNEQLRSVGKTINIDMLINDLNIGFIDDLIIPEDVDEDVAETTKNIQLAPTDIAKIVTVNEARASQGLGPLTDTNGQIDPAGEMTIEQYTAFTQSVPTGEMQQENVPQENV